MKFLDQILRNLLLEISFPISTLQEIPLLSGIET